MTTEEKIVEALDYANKKQLHAAQALGMSSSNFSQKLKHRTLKNDEIQRIAFICGAEWVTEFRFPDGTVI